MTVKVSLSIGYPSACRNDELEIDDDATEEQIDEIVQEWAQNYINVSWKKEGKSK